MNLLANFILFLEYPYYAKRYIGACRVLPDALNGKA